MKYLITGLGNIGEEYRNTRHNIGFTVLDALAKASILFLLTDVTEPLPPSRSKDASLSCWNRLLTWTWVEMQCATGCKRKHSVGKCVGSGGRPRPSFRYITSERKRQRCRTQWFETYSCYAGHTRLCPSALWYRQRFSRGGQIDFVLGHFTDKDLKTMDERVATACDIIKSFCLAGISITMNQYNKK